MKSIQHDLGKYVILRPRKDGTMRALFEVPARLRPAGWPPTIALPLDTPRTGDFARHPDEQLRVMNDAQMLNRRLDEERGQRVTGDSARTFATLLRQWRRTQAYKALKPRTQRGYEKTVRYIEAWSKAKGQPDPTKMKKAAVENFLADFDDRPTTRRMVKVVLKMVMDQAIDLGWRSDNPVAKIKSAMPKTRVGIWEAADVDLYAWACLAIGQPDMAALLYTQWEIGQRLTDCYLFRYGEEYAGGRFAFEQSKTEERVSFPVSARLQGLLAANRRPGKEYLFEDARFDRPYIRRIGARIEADDIAAAKVFAMARRVAIEHGGRSLKLKWLRHSCVVDLARSGAEIPEIVSITGHTLASAHNILQRYLPRDSRVAENAQRKRGLIGKESDGAQSDESDGSSERRVA